MVDRHTVKLVLKEPFVWLLQRLAGPEGRWIIAPEVVQQFGDLKKPESAIGTGPFTLERYEPNVKPVFKRNPAYFLAGQPYLDGAEWLSLEDESIGLAMHRTGPLVGREQVSAVKDGMPLRTNTLDELLWRRPAPLRDQRFMRRQQMRGAARIETVGIGPAFVHPAPGVGPVVVDLAAEQVPPDAPHVLILPEFLQALVPGKHVIHVVDFERKMVQAGLRVLETKEHVVIHVCLASVTAVERANEIPFVLHVHVV